ncbi:putative T7SS-secreted protein [Streptomyces xanthochromogenes]|uniref:putative T7SS-secreted protein n=1 Tax=Streptomyces xanthochromogenes TaxID=67384 RepID=UPI00343675CD
MVKPAGSAVAVGVHAVGGLLDRAGARHLADRVDDFGDAVAAALGAHVHEQQRGQTDLFGWFTATRSAGGAGLWRCCGSTPPSEWRVRGSKMPPMPGRGFHGVHV